MHPTGVPATIAIPVPPDVASPGARAGIPGPDSPAITSLVNRAADLLGQALEQERDAEDKAALADLIARCHKFASNRQKLADAALGASPAVRAMRKAY
jgi:hypothetical protein